MMLTAMKSKTLPQAANHIVQEMRILTDGRVAWVHAQGCPGCVTGAVLDPEPSAGPQIGRN